MFGAAVHGQLRYVAGHFEGLASGVVDGVDARGTPGRRRPGHREPFAAEAPDSDDEAFEVGERTHRQPGSSAKAKVAA